MKQLTAEQIMRLLRAHGWTERAGSGSHRIFKKDGTPALVTVPFHKGKRLPTGTQLAIMRAAGIGKEEL